MKKLLKYCLLVLLFAYLSFAIIWANNEARNELCKKITIDINNEDGTVFLTSEGIIKELENLGINPIGKPTSMINTDSIERILNRFDYLEGAECVIINNNTIAIQVNQMVPVMRVFSPKGSYYVNRNGKRIKADSRYHIDVPIVKGNFPYKNFTEKDLLPLIDYINENDALDTYVTAIVVNDPNNIFIIPNIQGHVVNIGSPVNLESKFAKITQLYKEVMPVKGWWAYDTISVKWNNQIVASRRQKALPKEVEYNPEEDEIAPDIGTITVTENTNNSIKTDSPSPKKENKETSEIKTNKKEVTTQNKEKIKKADKESSDIKKNKKKKNSSADDVTKKAFKSNDSSKKQKKKDKA